ncbi:MAG: endonuclease/exonuclease/phosphatase family protein [Verrucomicrobiota bacterium]|nr:endonuclease/exonuclease/phosphatase family protein [Verrucomicrobiota bacterium]
MNARHEKLNPNTLLKRSVSTSMERREAFLGLKMWHTTHAAGSILILALVGLGILLRITQYDTEGWLLAFYYATPWPVLAAVAGITALVCGTYRSFGLCFVATVICLGCALTWLGSSWKANRPAYTSAPPARFVYWNAAGPQQRAGKVMAHARAFDADFLAIGEAGLGTEEVLSRWRSTFKEQTVTRLSGEMLIATSGSLRSTRCGSLNQHGYYNSVELELQGRRLRVLLVDFDADATRSRRAAFNALHQIATAHVDEPLLVMGDFNTPADSRHFHHLRGVLRDAWASAGSGFSETWPVPLPVLRLDHIWVSPDVCPTSFRMDWSFLSDHRAQILEVVLP